MAKAVLRGTFLFIIAYISKEERFKNNIIFNHKRLQKAKKF